MKCRTIQRSLPEYFAGELDTTEQASIKAHLDACSKCHEEAENLFLLFKPGIERRPVWQQPDEAYWASILPRVRERIDRPRSASLPEWIIRFVMPVAAVAALIIVLFQLPVGTISHSTSPERILAQVPADELQLFTEQQTVIGLNEVSPASPDRTLREDKAVLKDIFSEETHAYALQTYSSTETVQETAFDNLTDQDAEQIVSILERNVSGSTN